MGGDVVFNCEILDDSESDDIELGCAYTNQAYCFASNESLADGFGKGLHDRSFSIAVGIRERRCVFIPMSIRFGYLVDRVASKPKRKLIHFIFHRECKDNIDIYIQMPELCSFPEKFDA